MLLEVAGMAVSAVVSGVLLVPAQSPICNVQFPNDGRFHPAVCSIGFDRPPRAVPKYRHHRGHRVGRLAQIGEKS